MTETGQYFTVFGFHLPNSICFSITTWRQNFLNFYLYIFCFKTLNSKNSFFVSVLRRADKTTIPEGERRPRHLQSLHRYQGPAGVPACLHLSSEGSSPEVSQVAQRWSWNECCSGKVSFQHYYIINLLRWSWHQHCSGKYLLNMQNAKSKMAFKLYKDEVGTNVVLLNVEPCKVWNPYCVSLLNMFWPKLDQKTSKLYFSIFFLSWSDNSL